MILPKAKTAIHVKTQEEYNELMKELEESGFTWNDGEKIRGKNKWETYREKTLIGIDKKNKTQYGTLMGFRGYTIEEYRPEFRVGDTVEKQNADIYDKIVNGTRGEVIRILLDTYLVRWFNGREFYYDPKYLKLFSRAEEPKPVENRPLFTTSYCFNEENLKKAEEMLELYETYPLQNYFWSKPLPRFINKPNKKTFMSNIVEFAKNQALKATNPDEFALRTARLKDQEGNWTADAIQIVKDLKAQQLGYKDANEANIKTATVPGACGVSFIEAIALFTEFAADLLKIATEKISSETRK